MEEERRSLRHRFYLELELIEEEEEEEEEGLSSVCAF